MVASIDSELGKRHEPTADKHMEERRSVPEQTRGSPGSAGPAPPRPDAAASRRQQVLAAGGRAGPGPSAPPAAVQSGAAAVGGGRVFSNRTGPATLLLGVPKAPKARPHGDGWHSHARSGPRGRTHAPADDGQVNKTRSTRATGHTPPQRGRESGHRPQPAPDRHRLHQVRPPGAPGSQGPRGGLGLGQDQRPLQPHGPTARLRWAAASNVCFTTKHTRL